VNVASPVPVVAPSTATADAAFAGLAPASPFVAILARHLETPGVSPAPDIGVADTGTPAPDADAAPVAAGGVMDAAMLAALLPLSLAPVPAPLAPAASPSAAMDATLSASAEPIRPARRDLEQALGALGVTVSPERAGGASVTPEIAPPSGDRLVPASAPARPTVVPSAVSRRSANAAAAHASSGAPGPASSAQSRAASPAATEPTASSAAGRGPGVAVQTGASTTANGVAAGSPADQTPDSALPGAGKQPVSAGSSAPLPVRSAGVDTGAPIQAAADDSRVSAQPSAVDALATARISSSAAADHTLLGASAVVTRSVSRDSPGSTRGDDTAAVIREPALIRRGADAPGAGTGSAVSAAGDSNARASSIADDGIVSPRLAAGASVTVVSSATLPRADALPSASAMLAGEIAVSAALPIAEAPPASAPAAFADRPATASGADPSGAEAEWALQAVVDEHASAGPFRTQAALDDSTSATDRARGASLRPTTSNQSAPVLGDSPVIPADADTAVPPIALAPESWASAGSRSSSTLLNHVVTATPAADVSTTTVATATAPTGVASAAGATTAAPPRAAEAPGNRGPRPARVAADGEPLRAVAPAPASASDAGLIQAVVDPALSHEDTDAQREHAGERDDSGAVAIAPPPARAGHAAGAASTRAEAAAPARSVAEQVAARISAIREPGRHEISLELRPPELGTVHVAARLEGRQVTLDIRAELGQARDLLQQALPALRESLEQQGIVAGRVTVHLGLDASPREFSGRDFDGFRDGFRRARTGTPAASGVAGIAEPGLGRASSAGRIDLRV